MRLLTHNMLKSHVKGVKNGYPLAIEVQMLFLLRNYIASEDNDFWSFEKSVLSANSKNIIFM